MSSLAYSLLPAWVLNVGDAAHALHSHLAGRRNRVAIGLAIVTLWAIVGLLLSIVAASLGADLGQILATA